MRFILIFCLLVYPLIIKAQGDIDTCLLNGNMNECINNICCGWSISYGRCVTFTTCGEQIFVDNGTYSVNVGSDGRVVFLPKNNQCSDCTSFEISAIISIIVFILIVTVCILGVCSNSFNKCLLKRIYRGKHEIFVYYYSNLIILIGTLLFISYMYAHFINPLAVIFAIGPLLLLATIRRDFNDNAYSGVIFITQLMTASFLAPLLFLSGYADIIIYWLMWSYFLVYTFAVPIHRHFNDSIHLISIIAYLIVFIINFCMNVYISAKYNSISPTYTFNCMALTIMLISIIERIINLVLLNFMNSINKSVNAGEVNPLL